MQINHKILAGVLDHLVDPACRAELLRGSFDFRESKEGQKFWIKICEQLEVGNSYLTLKQINAIKELQALNCTSS